MAVPWDERDHKLTGRIRVRCGYEKTGMFEFTPVLVAQVEETYIRFPVIGSDEAALSKVRWRDMRASDMPVPFITSG